MDKYKTPLPSLNQLTKVHVVGVGGTLMGAFAAFLKRRGIEVTGSDQNVYPPMSEVLKDAGVQIFNGYLAENLTGMKVRPDLVVIGNVISRENVEAKAAIEGGFAYTSLPEAMERILLPKTKNLVVAGTHGKTTTSSMLAHVLIKAGRDPSYFIGGVSPDLSVSFHLGQQAIQNQTGLFVLEGDEYDTAFWDKVPKFNHYLPNDVILTSVEYDHADIYPNFQAVRRAFEGLISRIRAPGKLIACYDYLVIKEMIQGSSFPKDHVLSYGSNRKTGARFTPGHIHIGEDRTQFVVMDGDRKIDEIAIRIPGNHNVLNALGVWIQGKELGLSSDEIRNALASFKGVKRRQEERGEVGGVLVIDDFAHHPTAVRETLRALRAKYSKRRVVAVFEPRSATSRRKVFQKDYGKAFEEVQATFISAPYDQTKIAAGEQFSSAELVADLKNLGKEAFLIESVENGVQQVAQFAQAGDVVAVLSNGGFGGFIPKLLEALKK